MCCRCPGDLLNNPCNINRTEKGEGEGDGDGESHEEEDDFHLAAVHLPGQAPSNQATDNRSKKDMT